MHYWFCSQCGELIIGSLEVVVQLAQTHRCEQVGQTPAIQVIPEHPLIKIEKEILDQTDPNEVSNA
jgi:hypothetical protein